MKEDKLNEWVQNFEQEMPAIQAELNAFFKSRNIHSYYRIQKNIDSGFFSVILIDRLDLPSEIMDRITEAHLRSRPVAF